MSLRILIDNALAHTSKGTVIKVGTHIRNGAASVVVTDDGPGIERSSHRRVFERFHTGDEVMRSRRGITEFELRLPAAS